MFFSSVKDYKIEHSLLGKVALITGASSGVGKASAYKLAEKGCHIILATRNKAKTEPIIQDIIEKTGNKNVEHIEFIADDLASVKNCAQEFLAKKLPLHILMNNAGLAGFSGVSKQGFQNTFAINYLSHFLLTEMLLDKLKESNPARIVNVASTGHRAGALYDFEKLREGEHAVVDRVYLQCYADSKLAQVMHTRKLAQILKDSGVTTYALHPGVVASDIWKVFPSFVQPVMKWFMLSEEQGALTQLYCATEPSLKESGKYYDNCQEASYNPLVDVQSNIDNLYTKSMEMIKDFLK
jgi:retinol dehydrogenase 12